MFGVDNAAIGFDAGDNSRSVAVAPDAISDSFGFVNVFRIDGMQNDLLDGLKCSL